VILPPPDPAFRWSVEPWGHALRCRPLESVAQHLFTTRQLELRPSARPGHSSSDGWAHAARSLSVGPEQVMRVKQVHGRAVRVLRKGERSPGAAEARPEADAQISNDPDLVLAVQVADCVPVLIADPRRGAASAVHAGWRGTSAGIARAAIEAMAREFASRPEELTVAIGPCIGACCYEVGAELVEVFRADGATAEQLSRWFAEDASGRLRLDLWLTTRDQIEAAGVPASRIFVAGLCTRTHSTILDSFRADGERAGRMAGMIRVPAGIRDRDRDRDRDQG
jgi:YfiH family protein